MRRSIKLLAVISLAASTYAAQTSDEKPLFHYQEVMVPMRDGVHLQTAILTPLDQKAPLPILLSRTPYGIPAKAPTTIAPRLKELMADGYILVYQNLRGRFKSEGVFKLSSQVNLADPKDVNETTDAYDAIDWLIKNVPQNNGRVGIYGVSYDGLTAALTLLHPHPALKAVSEQAAPVDQWMNDDMHRYGALRLSYAFEYSVMEQSDKNENTHFNFDIYDTYEWYLKLGPLSNANAKYLHGSLPFWNDTMEHPDYDAFWKREAWVNQLHSSPVPNLNVAGFWDQEDPWGPWKIFRNSAESDPQGNNLMVAGPWYHGQWQFPSAKAIGQISFGEHETAREFRENIEAPFFRYYLHGKGEKLPWKVSTFESGANAWRQYDAGLRRSRSPAICICMPTARSPSTLPPQRIPNSRNTFPTPRIRCPTANGQSRPLIPPAIGEPGKSPINASSITVPTYSASRARRSKAISGSPANSRRNCSPPHREPIAISW